MSTKPQFSIPEPCHEDWSNMSPTDKGRFCDSCAKEVKDFSRSKPAEIAETLKNSSGNVCGRFRKDQLTAKTPKLIDLIPTRPAHAAKVAAAALAFFSCDAGIAQDGPAHILGGKVAYKPAAQQTLVDSQIRGIVLDEHGEPLPFVSVHFTSNAGEIIGCTANEEGLFSMNNSNDPLDTPIVLVADYVGYQSKIINFNLKEDQFVEIRMDGAEYFLMGDTISIDEMEHLIEPPTEVKKEFGEVENSTEEVKTVELEVAHTVGLMEEVEEVEEIEIGEAVLQGYQIMGRISVPKIIDEVPAEDSVITGGIPNCIEIIEDEEQYLEGNIEIIVHEETTKGEVMLIPEVITTCSFGGIVSEEVKPIDSARSQGALIMGDMLLIQTTEPVQAPEQYTLTISTTEESAGNSVPSKILEQRDAVIRLYPNPSSYVLNVSTEGIPLDNYHVVDLRGKTVMEGSARNEALILDTSRLSNGQYMIMLFSGEEKLYSKQFVVSR